MPSAPPPTVGASKAFEAGLSIPACIFVGVVNAVGSGLIRDVLVREEPLLFKPGQFYVIASVLTRGRIRISRLYPEGADPGDCHSGNSGHICVPSPGHPVQLQTRSIKRPQLCN